MVERHTQSTYPLIMNPLGSIFYRQNGAEETDVHERMSLVPQISFLSGWSIDIIHHLCRPFGHL